MLNVVSTLMNIASGNTPNAGEQPAAAPKAAEAPTQFDDTPLANKLPAGVRADIATVMGAGYIHTGAVSTTLDPTGSIAQSHQNDAADYNHQIMQSINGMFVAEQRAAGSPQIPGVPDAGLDQARKQLRLTAEAAALNVKGSLLKTDMDGYAIPNNEHFQKAVGGLMGETGKADLARTLAVRDANPNAAPEDRTNAGLNSPAAARYGNDFVAAVGRAGKEAGIIPAVASAETYPAPNSSPGTQQRGVRQPGG